MILIMATLVGNALRKLYEKHVNTDEKRAVCRTVVQAVEQVYKELHGQEKMDEAMRMASNILADHGIKVTDSELQILLEAAVGEFNEAFHKKHNEIVNKS